MRSSSSTMSWFWRKTSRMVACMLFIYIIPLSSHLFYPSKASDKVVDLREKIKNFLAAQGMIKGHSGAGPRPNDQEPSILSLSADYASQVRVRRPRRCRSPATSDTRV
ncbi:hypothetical protein BDR07DRAFT_1017541 [Suillus spraguei]|nr:hypothetical protein BDR07DRAFT_1017541 [Suillus spraguei]